MVVIIILKFGVLTSLSRESRISVELDVDVSFFISTIFDWAEARG